MPTNDNFPPSKLLEKTIINVGKSMHYNCKIIFVIINKMRNKMRSIYISSEKMKIANKCKFKFRFRF